MHDRRAILISEHVLFRQGIAELLGDAGFAVTVAARIEQVRTRHAEVTVLDLDHALDDGQRLVQRLHDQVPKAAIVALGTPLRLAATADGISDIEVDTSRADASTLVAAVKGRSVAASPELARMHRQWAQVTRRQRDVLRWLAIGCDNRAIARPLRVGEGAVKAHVSALLQHFDLATRAQLALLAHDAGLRP